MKLVVTTEKHYYNEFQVIQSLQNIDWTAVEVLVYHSSQDNDVDTILEISRAGETVEKIIYINQEINSLYYGLFAGLKADIYNDESFLQDDETLGFLVEEYGETGLTMKSPNMDVETITKLLDTIATETPESLAKKISNPMWMKSLESSIKNVETALVRTDDANVNMVEIFNKTSEIIETLQQGQTRTTEEINKLSSYLKDIEEKAMNRNNNSAGVSIYPPFTVPNSAPRVLHIRVCSPCKFLFSFLNAYQDYLKMNKQINTKMIIAAPKLPQFIKKYESADFCRLAPDTINIRGIEQNNLFVTFEPKSMVWSKFFSMRTDIFIVIDMMMAEGIVKGSKVITLNAVSGISDIKRYQLDPKKTIISVMGLNTNIVIPSLQGYSFTQVPGKGTVPTNIQTKRGKYYERCKDGAYAKLDAFLGV